MRRNFNMRGLGSRLCCVKMARRLNDEADHEAGMMWLCPEGHPFEWDGKCWCQREMPPVYTVKEAPRCSECDGRADEVWRVYRDGGGEYDYGELLCYRCKRRHSPLTTLEPDDCWYEGGDFDHAAADRRSADEYRAKADYLRRMADVLDPRKPDRVD